MNLNRCLTSNQLRLITTFLNSPMPHSPPRAWVEIDLRALEHNYLTAQQLSGGSQLMAVVKANAYGHGMNNVQRTLASHAPAFFGVANVAEARELAELNSDISIYLLGPVAPEEQREVVERGWVACLSSLSEAQAFEALGHSLSKKCNVHLALDTGMGRGGFLPNSKELSDFLARNWDWLDLNGVGSHLPSADEDEEFTQSQITEFDGCILSHQLADLPYRHIANSAGLMKFRSQTANLVRPGLMLYGVSPLPEFQKELKPVMTLKSRISIVRDLPAGRSISYGRTFITERDTKVATVGIGYADGYPRSLSGTDMPVWINGHKVPVIGRVTMDQIVVDVTNCPVEAGDEVELFGANLSVAVLAEKAGTIPWEVFTGIAPRVERVYL